MKTKLLFLMAFVMASISYGQMVNGINYNITDTTNLEVEVIALDSGLYTGAISIPSSVTINNVTYAVTSILAYAFSDCSGLTSITIPEAVTSIDVAVFYNCTSLTNVSVNWTSPLIININVFYNLNLANLTLTVPSNTKSTYESATVWQDFGTIVEETTLSNTTNTIEGLVLSTNNGVVTSNLQNVVLTIYNVTGQQVANQNLSGINIVKAVASNGNIMVSKILVE